ncbi:MAG: sugar transporter, partial [Gammaproteobacteria bacterium]|nr:sugar transporter [Gammaproteobacteria bacterium]
MLAAETGNTISKATTRTENGQRKLPLTTKLAFGIGASGEAIYLGLSNAFIVIFYNQVIGLNNALIGLAVMLAMIGDAVSDPLVGIVSDRWRSRLGRRH